MCIAIACFPGCDTISFEISFEIVLIKLFIYMTKWSRQNFKYIEDKKSFKISDSTVYCIAYGH